jgi:putative multiple sugar transport system permease protein
MNPQDSASATVTNSVLPTPDAGVLAPQPAKRRRLFGGDVRQYGMLVALCVILGFFQIKTGGKTLKPLNVNNLIMQNSYIIIMAIGMLMVIVVGQIDLSVGSVAAFIGAVAGWLIVKHHVHILFAIPLTALLGAAIGAWNGYWVAYRKIPSFIVTLAGMLVFRGLTLEVLKGQPIGPFPSSFQKISTGWIPDFGGDKKIHLVSLFVGAIMSALLVLFDVRSRRDQVNNGFETSSVVAFVARNAAKVGAIMWLCFLLSKYNGLPNVLIITMLLVAVYTFVTVNAVVGRRIYAIGGNAKAAELSGVNSRRLTFFAFVNLGVLSALAGLVFLARFNSATPNAGTGFELDVIAACFIGGASASGGVGTVFGAVIGAFVMGVMNNGMSLLGVGTQRQMVVKGLVLLAAVFFDVVNKNKAAD